MLTVVILTKNEARNVGAVINNVRSIADDILIIDSGSTDGTIEIAKQEGARVIYHEWHDDFAEQRNVALKNTLTDWILYIDADERLSEDLIASLNEVLVSEQKAIYRTTRRNCAFGKSFKYGVLGPDSVLRLFPVEGVKWVGKVHEKPVGNYPIVTLDKGYINHHTYTTWEQYIGKMNVYAKIGAQNNYDHGKRCSVLKDLVFRPVFAFLKMYFIKLGVLEGWLGFVLSCTYAVYTFNKYIFLKFMEKENG